MIASAGKHRHPSLLAVVRDSAGNLYGTTESGGDLTCGNPGGLRHGV
jgi:hypothetical protein